MKFLITESKLVESIKKFILQEYPEVGDVFFTTKRVVLGSIKGLPVIEQTIINVVINNSKNQLKKDYISKLETNIIESVDSVFNLKYEDYGSLWDFKIYQLAITDLNASLPRI
jgi:hypothetical protein